MEKTTVQKQKKGADYMPQLLAAYKDYLLTKGNHPHSVYQFTKDLDLREEEFYKHFSSFDGLDRYLWEQFARQALEVVRSEKVYSEYSAREKVLAFYYTLIEILKKDRSYVAMTFKTARKSELVPVPLKSFKSEFDQFTNEVINEGLQSEEIAKRPVITDRYKDAIWLQWLFVLRFWLKDSSKSFENTDAAIEKSVNLAFELMGRGPLDMAVDLGKFLFQNR